MALKDRGFLTTDVAGPAASREWLQHFTYDLMIGRRSLLELIPIGPPVHLTRWRKIQVAWGWWVWRHSRLLYLLRPWRWDWANWPFHSTAEYD